MRWIDWIVGIIGVLLGLGIAGCAADPERAAIGEACDGVAMVCAAGAACEPEQAWVACGEPARCVDIAAICVGEQQPVCGCDGVMYAGACAAAEAGVSVGEARDCEAPVGSFACGRGYCRVDSQYCEWKTGGGRESTWTCRELGCEGGAQGCACLQGDAPCGADDLYFEQSCSLDEAGGARLLCLRP